MLLWIFDHTLRRVERVSSCVSACVSATRCLALVTRIHTVTHIHPNGSNRTISDTTKSTKQAADSTQSRLFRLLLVFVYFFFISRIFFLFLEYSESGRRITEIFVLDGQQSLMLALADINSSGVSRENHSQNCRFKATKFFFYSAMKLTLIAKHIQSM